MGGVIVEVASPSQYAAALELLRAVRHHVAEAVPDGVELVIACSADDLAAVALVDRDDARLAELVHRDAEALAPLLAFLAARGVHDALLWDQPASRLHHEELARAGFAFVAETVVMRRSLRVPPHPRRSFTHRTVDEVGAPAFAAYVAEALAGSPSRYIDPTDALAAFEAHVPAVFRAHWWTVAVLDGEVVGVVLPSPERDHQVAMSFLGLLPAWRGRGLGRDLLADALARLAAAGAHEYIDEADVLNVPAQRMLIGVGCERVSVRRRYRFSR